MRFGLLHSPFLTAVSTRPLAAALQALGHDAVAVSVTDDEGAAPISAYAHSAADQLIGPPLVLVAHSGAGPLLPVVAARREHGGVLGAVLVDATPPGLPGETRLAALHRADPRTGTAVARALYAGGRQPVWPAGELAALAARGERLRPRALAWFAEPIPVPATGWAELPWTYLQTSAAYDAAAATAEAAGRPVLRRSEGHLALLEHPGAVADDVVTLARLL